MKDTLVRILMHSDQKTYLPSGISALPEQTPFDVLVEEERQSLGRKAKLLTFSRDDALYTQGKNNFVLIYLVSGQVKLCCSASHGRECVLHVIRPGTIIDAGVLFYEESMPYSAVAISNGQAISFEKEAILAVCTRNANFSVKILKLMTARQRLFINKLAGSQGKISVSCRVSSWILHRSRMEGADTILFSVNRELLARLLGITRESLSRELSRLKSLGYIDVTKRQVQILDKAALQKISLM